MSLRLEFTEGGIKNHNTHIIFTRRRNYKTDRKVNPLSLLFHAPFEQASEGTTVILSIFIVIAIAVCWRSTTDGGFGQQEMSVACLVGVRPTLSEQIANTGENFWFSLLKNRYSCRH